MNDRVRFGSRGRDVFELTADVVAVEAFREQDHGLAPVDAAESPEQIGKGAEEATRIGVGLRRDGLRVLAQQPSDDRRLLRKSSREIRASASAAAFAALNRRVARQNELVTAQDFVGLVDGHFGDRTVHLSDEAAAHGAQLLAGGGRVGRERLRRPGTRQSEDRDAILPPDVFAQEPVRGIAHPLFAARADVILIEDQDEQLSLRRALVGRDIRGDRAFGRFDVRAASLPRPAETAGWAARRRRRRSAPRPAGCPESGAQRRPRSGRPSAPG